MRRQSLVCSPDVENRVEAVIACCCCLWLPVKPKGRGDGVCSIVIHSTCPDCHRSSIVVALRASTESSLSGFVCAGSREAHLSCLTCARYVRPSRGARRSRRLLEWLLRKSSNRRAVWCTSLLTLLWRRPSHGGVASSCFAPFLKVVVDFS